MRAKYLWKFVPSESYVRLFYARITLTKFTTSYFFLALAFCLTQILLLSISYSEHNGFLSFVRAVRSRSGVAEQFGAIADGELWVCDPLQTLQNGGPSQCRSLTAQGVENDIPLRIEMGNGEISDLTLRCVEALSWPKRLLRDASREDLALLAFQVWLFVLSSVAVVNESIPHLVAAFISHGTHTGWVAFQFPRWKRFYDRLEFFVVDDACGGIDLFPGFWEKRVGVLAPTLALSAISLILIAGLSFKLFKIYVKQVFKHLDSSTMLYRLYKIVMTFTVFMQLSSFFILISTALWVDELLTGMMSDHATHLKIYLAVFGIASLLDLIWIFLGYNSIRRECLYRSAGFVLVGASITAIWLFMFTSRLYRWTFSTWPFFACLTVMSFVYLVISIALAVVCRLNFGKGLAPYLRTHISYDDIDFIPVSPKKLESGEAYSEDDEKMDFLDVPITITVPEESSRGASIDQSRVSRRLSRLSKNRASWTTLLDNYSFRFSSPQSQRQTRINQDQPRDQLPSSVRRGPSLLSAVSSNTLSGRQRRPSSSGKDSEKGMPITWDELMGNKSENQYLTTLPSRPRKAATSGRERTRSSNDTPYVSEGANNTNNSAPRQIVNANSGGKNLKRGSGNSGSSGAAANGRGYSYI